MEEKIIPPGDDYLIRCPKLGHQIYFSYCRSENLGVPCFKTLDCWFKHFSVEKYLHQELTQEEWNNAFEKPARPKMQSLLEFIEQAKKSKKEKP